MHFETSRQRAFREPPGRFPEDVVPENPRDRETGIVHLLQAEPAYPGLDPYARRG